MDIINTVYLSAKKITLFSGLISLLFSLSCTNLDETLYSQLDNDNFLQTEEEISSALGAVYSGLRTFQKNDHLWTIYCTTDEVAIRAEPEVIGLAMGKTSK